MRFHAGSCSVCLTAVILCLTAPLAAADWPAYRHDVGHSGYTADTLPDAAKLNVYWTHSSAPPAPAWPEPVRERLMMDFDYAAQPVIANGTVFFGSSSDHKVYAVDLGTGMPRWTFFTEGPVRFAPQVVDGKVYVAGDDGMVYCLAAADGKCVWKVRGGPSDHRIIGNEQMISHWPLRSGLVVVDGTVYVTAGMWPMDGVWLVALKASDGSVVSKTQPNENFTPQGYMAATAASLIFPAGRGPICVTDRSGGAFKGIGAFAWIMSGAGAAVTGQGPDKGNENLPGVASPAFRPRAASVTVWAPDMSKPMGARPGKTVAAIAPDAVYVGGDAEVGALAVPGLAPKWSAPVKDALCLVAAGNAVVAGGDKKVTVLSAQDGKVLWSAPVEGEARGLAVADGRLIVSTTAGKVYCFAAGEGRERIQPMVEAVTTTDAAGQLAAQILKDSKLTSGYCLLIGAGDGNLAIDLARQSKLMIYCAEPDEKKAAAAREKLSAAGLYGTRVAVHHVGAGTLPYGDYFANLVVVQQAGFAPAAVGRVLRPYGGAAYALPAVSGQWIECDPLTRGPLAGGIQKAVRGKLPGASEWSHQYADAGNSASSGDSNVKWPLQVLWFGKPGPARIMNRHLRGTAPVTSNGRMFILGQHSVIAADAYNGRELWTRDLPSIQRRVVDIWGGNMVADDDSVYITTADICLRLDADTGQIKNTYRLPTGQTRLSLAGPQTIELDGGASVVMRATTEGLEMTLTSKDAKVTNLQPAGLPVRGDGWELFFDFRPADKRDGLYGSGAFQAIVVPASAESPQPRVSGGPLSKCPQMTATAGAGGATNVKISWAEVTKLVGSKPSDFTFGVILDSSDDGKSVNKRTYKFANTASYRLANGRGVMVVDAAGAAKTAAQSVLEKAGPAEHLVWGYLAAQGDTIVGSVVAWNDSASTLAHGWDYASEGHDYTGPMVGQVLGIIGLAKESKYIFGIDKNTGAVKWVYVATDVVPHNAIALGADKVYLIDRVSVPEVAAAKSRRGRRPPPPQPTPQAPLKGKIKVLSLSDGKEKWQVDDGLSDYQQLRLGRGILLAASMTGMTAFGVEDGKKLWSVVGNQPMHHCSAFLRAPVITGKWVYDEPFAYDLRSGEKRSAGAAPWQWGAGFGGCGTVSASENMLFYRAGNPGLVDTTSTADFHKFVGVRPGCYVNMVAACGLLLMPEASSGCGCPYNFQTTVALSPKSKQ